MGAGQPHKRKKRVPFSQEEVDLMISVKKRRALIYLQTFKGTWWYKIHNVFNVTCFFIYCELIICCFGPVHYLKHYSQRIIPHYGTEYDENNKAIIDELDILGITGDSYLFSIDKFMPIPEQRTVFFIGRDFILQKDLKGSFYGVDEGFRLFASHPVLLMSALIVCIMLVAFTFDLNENPHSLLGLTIMNTLAMSGLLAI